MQRRLLLLGAASVSLTGCGFELRRDPELLFRSIAMTGFKPGSPLALALRRQLALTSVKLLEDANRVDVVLEVLRDSSDKTAVVSTAAGQVREWQLRLRFDYLLRTPSGELLMPRTDLMMTREMNYTESMALAKEQEEALLFRAMQSEAVTQVMRRLAAVRLPS